jgi:hypothetical protein
MDSIKRCVLAGGALIHYISPAGACLTSTPPEKAGSNVGLFNL